MSPQMGRACDACHAQKIKCLVEKEGSSIGGPDLSCHSCRALRIRCTFDRPQRRRPRVRRVAKSHDAVSEGIPLSRDSTSPWSKESQRPIAENPKESTLNNQNRLPLHEEIGIEAICSEEIFTAIIQDYLNRLYCLTPLVHRPSFHKDLDERRASRDPLFFSFVFSLCVWVCSMLPVQFMSYRTDNGLFPYQSVADMVERCESAVTGLRKREYFEHPTNLHCCIAFALFHSLSAVGMTGRARIYAAELGALIQTLGANDPNNYTDLSYPDAQVRKKLFWLNFFVQAHARLGDDINRHYNWLPIPDTMFFDPALLEDIMPLAIDDEYIHCDHILPQPSEHVNITAGFVGIIRIFLCFVAPTHKVPHNVTKDGPIGSTVRSIVDWNALEDLQDMLFRIHAVAEKMPTALSLWLGPEPEMSFLSHDVADQLESMRANIHVTRLWARYLIFDRLIAVQDALYAPRPANRTLIISEHEAICDNLLQFLASVTVRSLESNGVSISFKIRQVAALLLEYSPRRQPRTSETPEGYIVRGTESPDERHQHSLTERADALIENFLDLLTQMDSKTMQDSQRLPWMQFWKDPRNGILITGKVSE